MFGARGLKLRLEREEGLAMWSSGRQFQTEGAASTNALRQKGIWRVGGIEKKPNGLSRERHGKKSRK